MWNIFSIFKELIIWALPFIGLHFYLKHFYQISSSQLISWWTKNFTSTESSYAIAIAFILLFLLFSLPFTSLINTFYLSLFGEKQTLVYLGNSSKSNSMYYSADDPTKVAFSGYNIDKGFNYSFSEVNKLKHFVKDPGTDKIAGVKSNRFHPYTLIANFLFAIFLLLPALGAIHALVYPMYINTQGNDALLTGSAKDSFDIILTQFNLTRHTTALVFFGALFAGIYFSKHAPDEIDDKQITPLPYNIKPAHTVTGTPIDLRIRYDKQTTHNANYPDQEKTYDTGFRNATFKFEDNFNPAVYVTLYFDKTVFPELENEIKEKIISRSTVKLHITDKLSLQPVIK